MPLSLVWTLVHEPFFARGQNSEETRMESDMELQFSLAMKLLLVLSLRAPQTLTYLLGTTWLGTET